MNTFIAILGLAALILVHEAGHFFTARAVRMNPRRFYVGFPPALVKVRRRGIEYGVGAIPLGGYVKIPGMHRPAPSDVDGHVGRALSEAPELYTPSERIKRPLAEGDFAAARTALERFEQALAHAPLSAATRRGVERGVEDLRDGLGEDAYWRQRAWKKVAVIFAGPGTNLLVAVALFTILLVTGPGRVTTGVEALSAAPEQRGPNDRVTSGFRQTAALDALLNQRTLSRAESAVVTDYYLARITPEEAEKRASVLRGREGERTIRAALPAELVGLQAGDRIVAIDGEKVTTLQMFERIAGSDGRPLRLTIERGGDEFTLGPIRAFEDTDGAYRLGFRPRFRELTIPAAFVEAMQLTGTITKEIGAALTRLVRGTGHEEISSPIGIARASSSALNRGAETYFWVLGFISLSLALLNLLPLLPLDGGHIAFSIFEGVRGRSVGREVYERVSVVGIMLVLVLFFIGLSNDLGGGPG